jgi:Domain of unknown function (DUF4760)
VITETTKILGETPGFWIQTGALFLSAIAAIALIYESSLAERRRAMIDLVVTQNQDEKLAAARQHILSLHEEKTQNFAKFLEDRTSQDFQRIMMVLNNHEFIACGIKRRALDEIMYKRMYCSAVLRDWQSCSGMVAELRRSTGKETLFQDFEWLVNRWIKDPLKKL